MDGSVVWHQYSNIGDYSLPGRPSGMSFGTIGTMILFYQASDTTEFDADIRMVSKDNDQIGFVFGGRNVQSHYAFVSTTQGRRTGLYRTARGSQVRNLGQTSSTYVNQHTRGYDSARRTLSGTIHWQYVRIRTRIVPTGLKIQVWVDFRPTTRSVARVWTKLFDVIDTDPVGPGVPGFLTHYDDGAFFAIDSYIIREGRCDALVAPGATLNPALTVLLDSASLRRMADDSIINYWHDSGGIGMFGPEDAMTSNMHFRKMRSTNNGGDFAVAQIRSGTQVGFPHPMQLSPHNAGQTIFLTFHIQETTSNRYSGVIYRSSFVDNSARTILWQEDFSNYPILHGFWKSNTFNSRGMTGAPQMTLQRAGCNYRDLAGTANDDMLVVTDWMYGRSYTDPGRNKHAPTYGKFLFFRFGSCNSAGMHVTSEWIEATSSAELKLEFEWGQDTDWETADWVSLDVQRSDRSGFSNDVWRASGKRTSSYNWRKETIDLSTRVGSGKFRFRFRARTSWAPEALRIDNIRVTAQASAIAVFYDRMTKNYCTRVARPSQRALVHCHPSQAEGALQATAPRQLAITLSVDSQQRTTPVFSLDGGPHSDWTPALGQLTYVQGPIQPENQFAPVAGPANLYMDIYHTRIYGRDLTAAERTHVTNSLIREYGARQAKCSFSALDGASNAVAASGSCTAGTGNNNDCRLQCRAGHALVSGSLLRGCRHGRWTYEPPRCAAQCPVLRSWPSNTFYGCKKGLIHKTFGGADGRLRPLENGVGSLSSQSPPGLEGARAWPTGDLAWQIRSGELVSGDVSACERETEEADRYAFFPFDGVYNEKMPIATSVRIKTSNAAGIVLRADSSIAQASRQARQHLLFAADFGTGRFSVSDHGWRGNGIPVKFCDSPMNAAQKAKAGQWVKLSGKAQGNSFSMFADDELVCEGGMTSGLSNGDAGLWTDRLGAETVFDDFIVETELLGDLCKAGCRVAIGQSCRARCDSPKIPRALSPLATPQADGYRFADLSTCSWNGTDAVLSIPDLQCGFPLPQVDSASFDVLEESMAGTLVGVPLNASVPFDTSGLEVRFRIASGNGNDAFSISDCTGQLRVNNASALDFESGQTLYTLVLDAATAGDFASSAIQVIITVNVRDRNEPPIIVPQTRIIAENSPESANVGAPLVVSDPEGVTPLLSISLGNADGMFALDASTGQLTVADNTKLDHELFEVVSISVVATDGADATLTATTTITIVISDVDEPPVVLNTTFTLAEDFDATAAGSRVLGSITAQDPDAGDNATTSILPGWDSDYFVVFPDGVVEVSSDSPFDFETKPSVVASVKAIDKAGNVGFGFIMVTVSDVDEPPVVAWPSSINVAENSAAGSHAVSINAVEVDAGQSVVAAITAQSPAGAFSIVAPALAGGGLVNLSVADSTVLDHETNPVVNVTIEISDSTLANVLSRSFAVSVTDINEPPVLAVTRPSVVENSANGAAVTTLTATDPEGDAVTFELGAGASAVPFSLTSGGNLTVKNPPGVDFETQSAWIVSVTCKDTSNSWTTTNMTVTITDANDAPSIRAGVSFNHPATNAGSVGGQLNGIALTDQDLFNAGSLESHTWSITAQSRNGAGAVMLFDIDAGTGQLSVSTGNSASLQQSQTYTINVRVADRAGLTATGAITVAIVDGNAPPTNLDTDPVVLVAPENAAPGSGFGRASATDPNSGQTVSFRLVPHGHSLQSPFFPFEVNGAGVFVVRAINGVPAFEAVNYEGAFRNWSATLEATDDHSSPLTTRRVLTIFVRDVPEDPFFDSRDRRGNAAAFTVSMPESSALGAFAAVAPVTAIVDGLVYGLVAHPAGGLAVVAGDDETPASLTYSWDGSGCTVLQINATTGQIAPTGTADFETGPVVTCIAVATDPTTRTDSAAITVQVADANDAPRVAAGQVVTVAEPSSAAMMAGTIVPGSLFLRPFVAFSDEDSNPQWGGPTASLEARRITVTEYRNSSLANASKTFAELEEDYIGAVLAVDSASGELSVVAGAESLVDWELRREVRVPVVVTDAAGLATTVPITVRFADVADATIADVYLSGAEPSLATWLAEKEAARAEQVLDSSSDSASGIAATENRANEAGAAVTLPTDGSGSVVFRGYDLSPSTSQMVRFAETLADYSRINATYGPATMPQMYTSACTATAALHELTCTTQPGIGLGHVWRLTQTRKNSQGVDVVQVIAISDGLTTGYEPPVITAITVQNAIRQQLPMNGAGVQLLVDGRNFGPAGTPVTLKFGPVNDAGATFAASCTLLVDHTQASCDLVPGAGRDLAFVIVVAGSTSDVFTTDAAYVPPSVSSVGLGVLATAGGQVVSLTGQGLPVAEVLASASVVVEYSASFAPATVAAQANTANTIVYRAGSCTAPPASAADAGRRLTCVSAPGVGGGLAWRVTVTGRQSPVSQTVPVTSAYAAPAIQAVEGPGVINAATRGGDVFYIIGTSFGRPIVNHTGVPAPVVEYGTGDGSTGLPFVSRYSGVDCKVSVADTVLECKTAPGTGKGHTWRVDIAGQLSVVQTANPQAYHPPVVSIEEGGAAGVDVLALETPGSQRVRVRGLHFGPTSATIASVKYGPTDPNSPTGDLEYSAVSCNMETPHESILCTTVEGAGQGHRWEVVVDGQKSVNPATSYARPVITAIGGAGASDGSPLGGQEIVLSGTSFGPMIADYLEAVSYGVTGYEFTATGCSVTAAHTTIRCTTVASTPGRTYRWVVKVRGQYSEPSSATTTTAHPRIARVSPLPFTSGTPGGGMLVIQGTAFGTTSTTARPVLRFNNQAVQRPSTFGLQRIAGGDVLPAQGSSAAIPAYEFVEVDASSAATPLARYVDSPPSLLAWARTLTELRPLTERIVGTGGASSEEMLTFTIPEGFGADGEAFLVVGDAVVSNVVQFDYDAPVISNLAPDRLSPTAGTLRLFIEGTSFCSNGHLTGCGKVLVDGAESTAIVTWTHESIQLTTRVPSGTSDFVSIQVVVGEQASAVKQFNRPVPSFDALTTDQGTWTNMDPAGGQRFFIAGVRDVDSYPESSLSIEIGTRPCTNLRRVREGQVVEGGVTIVLSRLQCDTPAGVGSGIPIAIVVDLGGGADPLRTHSAGGSTLPYSYAPPTVTSIVLANASGSILFGPGKNSDLPTVGAAVRIFGTGLGTTALDPALRVAVEETASVALVASDSETSQTFLDVHIGPGEGRERGVALSVGNQQPAITPSISYRAPTLMAVLPRPPSAPTSGAFVVTIFGSDFGVGSSPNITIGGLACPLVAGWVPVPGHDEIRCIAPASSGADLTVSVLVRGQTGTSTSSQNRFDFNRPVITAITPTSASTSGLDPDGTTRTAVTLTGSDFGPHGEVQLVLDLDRAVASGDEITIATVRSTDPAPSTAADGVARIGGAITSWGHSRISMLLPEGFGEFVYPRVASNGQVSDDAATAELAPATILVFDPPSVTGLARADRDAVSCAPQQRCYTLVTGTRACVAVPAECYDTAGGYALRIDGDSFGSGPIAEAATSVSVGGMPSVLVPSLGRTHTSLVVQVPAGMGIDLPVIVTVGGRSSIVSRGSLFSYDPPIIRSLMPNTPDATGGQEIMVRGKNFGTTANEVQVLINADECSDAEWLNDGTVRCSVPAMLVGPKNITLFAANRTEPTLLRDFEELLVAECKPGSYGLAGETCANCMDVMPGASCPGYERYSDLVTSVKGWWRFNVSATDSRCPPHRAMEGKRMGDTPFTEGNSYWCPHVTPCEPRSACIGSNLCAPGYTGERCGKCIPGQFYRVNGLCERCPDNPWLIVVVFVVVGLGACAFGFLLNSKNVNVAFVSIGVDYFQVLAIFARARVQWPPILKEILRVLSAFNLNLDLAAPECAIPDMTFSAKWFLMAGIPVAVGAVFALSFGAQYCWKRFIKGMAKRKWTEHGDRYVSITIVVAYILYFQETRNSLDVFNCNSTDPPDGKEYLSGMTDVVCFETGEHLFLIPFGLTAFVGFSLLFPFYVYTFLRRHRLEIKYDQVLRARNINVDSVEMPNVEPSDSRDPPNIRRFRLRYQRLYYMFRLGKASYWICVLLLRKFLIAGCSLLFRGQPSYQLAIALLVMFASYVVQVRNLPFMSPGDFDRELVEHHRASMKPIDVRLSHHQQIRAWMERWSERMSGKSATRKSSGWRVAVEEFADSGALEQRSRNLTIASLIVDYNSVEALLLACAVLVNLSGLMFLSERFAEDRIDLYRSEYDSLAYTIATIVILSLIYFVAVLSFEVLMRVNPGAATSILSVCPGGRSAKKRADGAALASKGSMHSTDDGALVGDTPGNSAGNGKVTMQVSALVALNSDKHAEAGGAVVRSAELPMEPPSDPRVWAAVRKQFVVNEKAMSQLRMDLQMQHSIMIREQTLPGSGVPGGMTQQSSIAAAAARGETVGGMTSMNPLAQRRSGGATKVRKTFATSKAAEGRASTKLKRGFSVVHAAPGAASAMESVSSEDIPDDIPDEVADDIPDSPRTAEAVSSQATLPEA